MRSEGLMDVSEDLRTSDKAGKSNSRTKVVFPEPLVPVTQTTLPSGMWTVTSFRLFRAACESFKPALVSDIRLKGIRDSFNLRDWLRMEYDSARGEGDGVGSNSTDLGSGAGISRLALKYSPVRVPLAVRISE